MSARGDPTGLGARRAVGRALVVCLVLLAVLVPKVALTSSYQLGVMRLAFYLALLASTWSLLAGVAGQFSFAHVAIAGLGGYAGAIWTSRLGDSWPALGNIWVGIAVGTVVSGVVGAVLALLLDRLRGVYFALFTMAFGEIVHVVIIAEWEITGGAVSLPVAQLPGSSLLHYYVVLGALVATLVIVYAVVNSHWGMLLRAVREDEEAAAAMGVDTPRVKFLVIVLTSLLIGFGASVYFHTTPRIAPDNVDLLVMTEVVAYTVIGGLESPLAAAIAAIGFFFFLEKMRSLDLGPGELTILAACALAVSVMLLARVVVLWRRQDPASRRAPGGPVGALAAGAGLFAWVLFGPISAVGGWERPTATVLAGVAILAFFVLWRRSGRGHHRGGPLPVLLMGGVLTALLAIRLATLESAQVEFGVWRMAAFGSVLVLTLRFAPNGVLTPLVDFLGGREAAALAAARARWEASEAAVDGAADVRDGTPIGRVR